MSSPTLCDSMNYSPAGSSVHGILQARILEWVAISFSGVSSWPRDRSWVSHIADRFFTIWATCICMYVYLIFIYLAVLGLSCGLWTLRCGMWDLVPRPGIEPKLHAWGVQSLSHCTTREVPSIVSFWKYKQMYTHLPHIQKLEFISCTHISAP